MCAAAESPSSDAVRVFIGNLVPTISDVALLRLFSRFGEASQLERNTKGFAHLSVKPKGEKGSDDIERCVNALNRTSWCGTTLRVERAQEHYLARLKCEWAEAQHQDDDSMDVMTDGPREDHFANFKKGRHTRFSFPDLEPKSILATQNEDQCEQMNSTTLKSRPADQLSDANSSPKETPVNPSSTKSVKLDSTLALFGLSSISVDEPHIVGKVREKKRHDPPREHSPAKRPRSRACDEERAVEVSENPSEIDVSLEKKAARMVLQKLFPESLTPSSAESCRRLGLYRKLLQAPDVESNRDENEAGRHEQASLHVTDPFHSSETPKGRPVLSFRRAGLYRLLISQALPK